MPELAPPSESIDNATLRRETVLAGILAVSGIAAILFARGGIENMIAGSVGSVGGGCIAVGLTFLDGRLAYAHRVQASLPIIMMLAVAGYAVAGNALALAGWPLLLLGLAGLLSIWWRSASSRTSVESTVDEGKRHHATVTPALSN